MDDSVPINNVLEFHFCQAFRQSLVFRGSGEFLRSTPFSSCCLPSSGCLRLRERRLNGLELTVLSDGDSDIFKERRVEREVWLTSHSHSISLQRLFSV